MRNKRNNGGILREARNEFEAELTSDTLLCFLLTDSGMTTYEISPTIYSPVRKDLEWSLTCNKGPHFATPLPGWDRNASSTDVMGYQDRTRYDGRPHYIIHNPGKGISRSGTFADVPCASCMFGGGQIRSLCTSCTHPRSPASLHPASIKTIQNF